MRYLEQSEHRDRKRNGGFQGLQEGELLFSRYRVLVLEDERGMGMSGGGGGTTM